MAISRPTRSSSRGEPIIVHTHGDIAMTNAAWNVLIYANAEDDKAEAVARQAISDMRNVVPCNCNIAVQLNTVAAMERYWISNTEDRSERSRSVDTTTSEALTDFIDTATKHFHRRATLLVMFAHGSG